MRFMDDRRKFKSFFIARHCNSNYVCQSVAFRYSMEVA